jgi:cell division protein FtsI (penicillin-binding protein 3)
LDARAEPLTTKRLRILARSSLIWGVLILCRLVQLQIVRHEELRKSALQQQDREIEIQAPRGVIFDRNGHRLAMSLPVDSVCINPLKVPDMMVAADLLSRELQVSHDELVGKMATAIDRGRGFMWVKRKLSPEESERIRHFNLDWLEFRPESRRFYPNGSLAANLLGGVDHDERGNGGIELSLEDELEGRPGVIRTSSDVKKNVFASQVFSDPQPGKDITLTIDERIQFVAEETLREAVIANHCKTGTLVAMDPNTGEILALASYPTFDPNKQLEKGDSIDDRANLAISSPFEPGSVFKTVTLSAALETTRLRPESLIDCGMGVMTLFHRVIHDAARHGVLTVAEVLQKSSNIGAIKIGMQVGDQNLYEYIRRFGFGERTGIALPGESGGVVRPLKKWIPTSIGSVAMGHEVSTTSLQLARAGVVIANGGLLIKPRITLKRQRPGNEPDPIEPEAAPVRVIRPETAITMRRIMMGVVTPSGTAPNAHLDGYTSGGKTGSAQIYDFAAHAYTHKYNASFVGFAPANNPRIVIAVTLNGSSLFGGAVAGPVFRKVAMEALRYMEVPKDKPEEELVPVDAVPAAPEDVSIADLGGPRSALDEEVAAQVAGGTVAAPAEQNTVASLAPTGKVVPDLRGLTVRAMLERTSTLGALVESTGSGIVREQQPMPGSPLRQGERIRVELGR